MARDGISVRIYGLKEVRRALRKLPDDAQEEMRQGALRIAENLAGKIRAAAAASDAQSALMAPTVKADRSGYMPMVTAGGDRLVGRNRKPAKKILFGSEFGASVLRQFRPHLGAGSYWFFKTQERNKPATDREWSDVAGEIIGRWSA